MLHHPCLKLSHYQTLSEKGKNSGAIAPIDMLLQCSVALPRSYQACDITMKSSLCQAILKR
uniref:NHL8 n=1 Tax=Arundo donax TaxID=35708 RepID=A0A0A8XZL7_ARUDO